MCALSTLFESPLTFESMDGRVLARSDGTARYGRTGLARADGTDATVRMDGTGTGGRDWDGTARTRGRKSAGMHGEGINNNSNNISNSNSNDNK